MLITPTKLFLFMPLLWNISYLLFSNNFVLFQLEFISSSFRKKYMSFIYEIPSYLSFPGISEVFILQQNIFLLERFQLERKNGKKAHQFQHEKQGFKTANKSSPSHEGIWMRVGKGEYKGKNMYLRKQFILSWT